MCYSQWDTQRYAARSQQKYVMTSIIRHELVAAFARLRCHHCEQNWCNYPNLKQTPTLKLLPIWEAAECLQRTIRARRGIARLIHISFVEFLGKYFGETMFGQITPSNKVQIVIKTNATQLCPYILIYMLFTYPLKNNTLTSQKKIYTFHAR